MRQGNQNLPPRFGGPTGLNLTSQCCPPSRSPAECWVSAFYQVALSWIWFVLTAFLGERLSTEKQPQLVDAIKMENGQIHP
jgi:hypothetical protein